MSEAISGTYTELHLRFKLRVPPDVFFAKSLEAARVIAWADGLIWKIWLSRQQELEMGGMYLFANREAAKAYLNHPVIQVVCSNPAVISRASVARSALRSRPSCW